MVRFTHVDNIEPQYDDTNCVLIAQNGASWVLTGKISLSNGWKEIASALKKCFERSKDMNTYSLSALTFDLEVCKKIEWKNKKSDLRSDVNHISWVIIPKFVYYSLSSLSMRIMILNNYFSHVGRESGGLFQTRILSQY